MNLFIFDLDGTICKTESLHKDIFRQVLYNHGIENLNIDYQKFLQYTDSQIAKSSFVEIGVHINKSFLNQLEKCMNELYLNKVFTEINGAKHLLSQLEKDDQYCYGVATGSFRLPAETKLKKLGIDLDLEAQLVTSSEFFKRDEIILSLISKLKKCSNVSSFEKIISIGDGLWDLLTAKFLNIEFIGIGNRFKDQEVESYLDFSCFKYSNY